MYKIILGGMAATAAIMLAVPASAQTAPQAKVAQGMLTGAVDNGVSVFRGIPYAAPPVGRLRWAPPAAPASWTGARPAAKFSAGCPQTAAPVGRPPWTIEFMHPVADGFSEDCLYLNVWTAAKAGAKLPVLVFMHGGGNVEGSGSVPVYNGVGLAKKGVIVVTPNYRLGVFGSFAHPTLTAEQGGASGNYGLQDEIAVLKWVKANIAAFGGDPDKVTLAGQSAGAGNVLNLMVSPAANGLYRSTIIESTGGVLADGNRQPLATGEKAGVDSLAKAKIETIAQARAMTTDQIVAANFARSGAADGKVIPANAGQARSGVVPMLVSIVLHDQQTGRKRHVTAAEWKADVTARYGENAPALLKMLPGDTDAQATVSANEEVSERFYMQAIVAWRAKQPAGSTAPLFVDRFSHVMPGPESDKWGAFHTSEVPYVFDALRLAPDRTFTALDHRLADQVSSYWANFIKTGNPNGAGLTQWPAMTPENQAILDLGDTVAVRRPATPAAEALYATAKPPSRQPAS